MNSAVKTKEKAPMTKPVKQKKDGGLIPSERGTVLSHVFGAV